VSVDEQAELLFVPESIGFGNIAIKSLMLAIFTT